MTHEKARLNRTDAGKPVADGKARLTIAANNLMILRQVAKPSIQTVPHAGAGTEAQNLRHQQW